MPTDTQQHPLISRLRALAAPVCVAVACPSPEGLFAQAASLLPQCPLLELRLDALSEPGAGVQVVHQLRQGFPEALLLATCRTQRSGGDFRGTAGEEWNHLQQAAQAGAALVDLSLESAEELGPVALATLRSHRTAVLLSFHDFERTGDLSAVLARMQPFGPDIYKIVPTARSLDDSLALLAFLATHSQANLPIVAMAMGEPGVPSRVLGPRAGSLFTFAAATSEGATAPGQLPASALSGLYRIHDLDTGTQLYGVAGDPIQSSLSPRMLNTAFQQAGMDAVYLPLKTANAGELFRVARALPLSGFSVTMPLKQAVMPLLDSIAPLAARIGAVNTVRRTPEGRFHGDNTDAAGIALPLMQRMDLRGARVLVLGAGGAARAAVFACVDRGAQVFIHNRTAAAALALAQEAGAAALPADALATNSFDVLIHATPAGMRGNPRTLPLEPHQLRAALVFDLVYNPLETPLLELAREQGRDVLHGVEMFVHQGARQFELWTGSQAPVAVMRHTVEQALTPSP